ncbi:MAG: aspartate 1-decarboxylase, partial [Symploca sp. SIO3E6]|nr:aspartate 1-decarboxylase [Caldora sp. SIO3E6]
EQCDRAEVMRKGHQARVLVADENNHVQDVFYQTLTPNGETLDYDGYGTEGYGSKNGKRTTKIPITVGV